MDLQADPNVAAALTAAFELLFFVTAHSANQQHADHLTYLSNLRTVVLPMIYPNQL